MTNLKEFDSTKGGIYLIAFIVLMFALREVGGIVQPLMLSVLLTLMLNPLITYCEEKLQVPRIITASITLAALLIIVSTGITMLSKSLINFQSDIGAITASAQSLITEAESKLFEYGLDVELASFVNVGKLSSVSMSFMSHVGGTMSYMFISTMMTLFMLTEAPQWGEKLQLITKSNGSIDEILSSVNQYLAVKFLTSFSTGVIVALSLAKIGHSYWFALGLVAFILNYIPSVGSFLAAIPAVFLAIVTMGFAESVLTITVYVLVNVIIGSMIEPRIIGEKLKLSTLVILVSMLLWGWMFSIIGMFLSVPITIAAKLLIEKNDPDHFIPKLLSN
ncbi:putative AI-2 transport protein TqsA [Vibrio chagasii]|nr:putative AI-2 transport protein TqsA [Vibrio chagasii]